MAKLNLLDKTKEEGGVWLSYDPQPNTGMRVKLARMNNPRMAQWMRSMRLDRMRHWREHTTSEEEAAERFLFEAMSEFVVLDWECFDDHVTGQSLACSPEAVFAYLINPAASQFTTFVLVKSREDEAYLKEQQAADSKNSVPA